MQASLTHYKQSPRKVRLVANLLKGKTADEALVELTFMDKRAAAPIRKLLLSAIANAKENMKLEKDRLYVKDVRIDKGMTIKRFRSAWRGTVHPINRRRSHIKIELAEIDKEKSTGKEEKNVKEK